MERRGGYGEVVCAAAFALLTGALAAGALLDLDLAVRNWVDAHRPEPLRLAAKALYFLGSANLIASILLVAAVLLGARDRTVRPVLLVLVTAAASYVVVVPLKILTDRSAPHAPWPDAVQLFTHDAGWSYPSGHVVNTLIWYPVLVALAQRALRRPLPGRLRRALLVVPVVTVFVAVTYLGYHWITDCAAGVLLGLALRLGLRRLPLES
ncbi:phosphatase PAP2 family protein [Phytohabitans sp. LJ34]|uniref:phosphatase PAP2 family protein n=1 Tax=Phytohabitans sp. LJ34 TaxID=3452217 RepID=UPI003F8BC3A9